MKRAALIGLVVAVILIMEGGRGYGQKAGPKTLDIGVATPLTGPAAHIGMNMKNAILMAIEDQNAQGGVRIAGETYVLNPIILDTKKDAAVGKSVAEELVYGRKVKVIAGPFIDDAMGAQSVTEPNKIIAFFVSPSTPDMTGPSKPYSFFVNGLIPQLFSVGAAYIQKFYPNAKKQRLNLCTVSINMHPTQIILR